MQALVDTDIESATTRTKMTIDLAILLMRIH